MTLRRPVVLGCTRHRIIRRDVLSTMGSHTIGNDRFIPISVSMVRKV